ncbi:hypothetical protein ACFQVC_12075 [Streptomyces monticola]|uniref:Secreted protein n=1 Tax=Streptomyces monticola TaxID=2666263 RepID=A0ABW2JHI8_9ACTN
MASLAWLLIPLVAAICAGMWGSWAARNRRTGDVTELAGYARFRAAMERAELDKAVAEAAERERAAADRAGAELPEMEKAGSGSDAA